MPEIIQEWLASKLGILLDLTPKTFGQNTQDGKLLAKMLYNYGVIPASVLNEIKESSNYYVCYKNLITLKPWLNFIGVIVEESTLKEIAGSKGTASISLFYEVYLNLEGKDKLYYVSFQKERRVSEDKCRDRFNVNWVSETVPVGDSNDDDVNYSKLLHDKHDMIEWHKKKCKEVVETIKKTKERFRKMMDKKPVLGPVISKHTTSQPLSKREQEAEETKETIKEFEKKLPKEQNELTYEGLMELKNMINMRPCMVVPNVAEAQKTICKIKHKKKSDLFARNFAQKMEDTVLEEQWKEVIGKRDEDFENKVCEAFLKQSHYEKQMTNKLYQMRHQKKVLAENRKKVENLKIERRDKEFYDMKNEKAEMEREFLEQDQLEREKKLELHRRLYDEKVKMRKEQCINEAKRSIEAIMNIAIRISEARNLSGCEVAKSYLNDMKQLFFKDLNILPWLDDFDAICDESQLTPEKMDREKDLEEEGEGAEVESGDETIFDAESERIREEEERRKILDDSDFNDYLNLLGPWMIQLLFPDSSETEVKQVVLGYIVHKLLEIKYPISNLPNSYAPIKPMKPRAVVQGLEESAYEMLVDLMDLCKVLVVRVDDAIRFVLSAYKEELSVVGDIDINFQKMTANTFSTKDKLGNIKETEGKKIQIQKKEQPDKAIVAINEHNSLDKETQTPRMILDEDPILSPNAELGKKAFEALGAGDPVPDHVIASAIVGYVVANQEDYNGWILLNYPLLYSQAKYLECLLTGSDIIPPIDDMELLENVEGFSFRENCVNPLEQEEYEAKRNSQLVPKPYVQQVGSSAKNTSSYFDIFVKVKRIGDVAKNPPSQDSAVLSPLDKFYLDQEIFFRFDYVAMNFQSVKNLGKIVLGHITEIGGKNNVLAAKTSLEIFGSEVPMLNEKWGTGKMIKGSEKGSIKVRIKVKKSTGTGDGLDSQFGDTNDAYGKNRLSSAHPSPAKPGDPDWEWVTGSQPKEVQLALATLWENMEAIYIKDFKNIFFYVRSHRSNVLQFVMFLKNSALELMRELDEKTKVVNDFQQMYNDIDSDLRPDVDIKCELHVRVSELEEALMVIADNRKRSFRTHLAKIIESGWLGDEMANLVNYYLMALQLEADRCVDTCQILNDYYLTLQEKIPDQKTMGKVVVPKLLVGEKKYSVVMAHSGRTFSITPGMQETRRGTRSSFEQANKSTHEKLTKTRSWRRRSSEATFLNGAAEFMMDILMSRTMPEDGMTPFHQFLIDNVRSVTSEVSSLVEGCLSETKKGEKGGGKKPKKVSAGKSVSNMNQNLLAEWSTALSEELTRFQFRTKLILARGIFEMNEFLTTLLNVTTHTWEEINQMYENETQSILECSKVFRCAIEREERIQPRLELCGSEFFVNYSVRTFEDSYAKNTVVDETDDYSFSMDQLMLLFNKLQRVAPEGEIIKRSFVFILEDLRTLRPEVENGNCLPQNWKKMKPNDITSLLDEIYQDLEIVNWKDFIIYGLRIPMPSANEILAARQMFRNHDPLQTELITREKYDGVSFWFDSTLKYTSLTDELEKAKDLLFRMYQVNEYEANYSALLLAFCKDRDPVLGFIKALTLIVGQKIVLRAKGEKEVVTDNEELYEYYYNKDEEKTSSGRKGVCSCKSFSTETSESTDHQQKDRSRCTCCYSKNDPKSDDVDYEEYFEKFEEATTWAYSPLSPVVRDTGTSSSSVPFNIVSSLLKASFPSLPQLTILLDCKETFQDTLNSIYDSLHSTDGRVEIDDLLNHNFICRLLKCTNKFKFLDFLQFKQLEPSLNLMGPCHPDQPNCAQFLN